MQRCMSHVDLEIEALLSTLFQAHPWHGVAAESARPGVFNAYIELVPTDTVKYELDKRLGHLRLDRPQRFSSLCPTLYGFIPRTYCGKAVAARCAERAQVPEIEGDGDPIDVCILSEKATAHGDFLACVRPIGGMRMIDGTEADDKIIGVLESDIAFGHMHDISECPKGIIERLHHYFLSYKQQPGSPTDHVRIAEIYGRDEALHVIGLSQQDYHAEFGAADVRIRGLRRLLTTAVSEA